MTRLRLPFSVLSAPPGGAHVETIDAFPTLVLLPGALADADREAGRFLPGIFGTHSALAKDGVETVVALHVLLTPLETEVR